MALAFTVLVLYASLYPFSGWRWPPGRGVLELLVLPWPPWQSRFDMWANFVGYLPLGLLLCVTRLRKNKGNAYSLFWAGACAALLSYLTETTQHFLPGRYPSAMDWSLNSLGGAAGACLATLLNRVGALAHWDSVKSRWFERDSAGGLLLMAMWPVGLLFPAPLPLGLGHVGPKLRDWSLAALADVPWANTVHQALEGAPPPTLAVSALSDGLVQMLGLLAPCLAAFCIARPGWRRGVLVLGAVGLGAAATTLSAALSFGPEHALGWATPMTPLSWALGMVAAALFSWLPPRAMSALACVALTALVVLVAQAPADPYFAQSLQAWEQGRFIHFNGLALWVGWLWPYLTLGWLVWRRPVRP